MESLKVVSQPSFEISLGQFDADEILQSFLSGKSPRTLQAYKQDLEQFALFLQVPTPEIAVRLLLAHGQGNGNAMVTRFKSSMLEKNLAPATINRRLAAIRSFIDLARSFGSVNWNLEVKNVPSQSYRDTRGTGLEGFIRLFQQIKGNSPKAFRDKAILRLLFDLALRRAEITELNVENMQLSDNTVSILGKGKRERINLSLPDQTKAALSDWLEKHPTKTGALFPHFNHGKPSSRITGAGLYHLIRSLGKKAGIKARPHGIRHSAISEAVKSAQSNGIGIEEVLDFSRHKDVKTLMVYRDRERDVQGKLANLVAAKVA